MPPPQHSYCSQTESSLRGSSQNGCAICGPNEELSKTNLYIRGLKSDATDKDLLELCQPYGKIISTKAIVDLENGNCKGYGFVDYESEKSAESALKALQSTGIQAQMAKLQVQDTTNLYMTGLPNYLTEKDLEIMLSRYGRVISTRILRDNAGISRGVGFTRMESKKACDAAIKAFNGKCLPGYKDPLTAKFADGCYKKKTLNKHHNQQKPDDGPQYQNIALTPNGIGLPSPPILLMSMNGCYPPAYTALSLPMSNYYLPSTCATASGGNWFPCSTSYVEQLPLSTQLYPSSPAFLSDISSSADTALFSHVPSSAGHKHVSPQQYSAGPAGTIALLQMLYPPPPVLQAIRQEGSQSEIHSSSRYITDVTYST